VNRADKVFAKVIAGYTPRARAGLTELRSLVLATAKDTDGVGQIEEGLRWGQHSFLTSETGSGSTIRIDGLRNYPGTIAMFFHCQSGLIDQFRELYGDKLTYDGKRALLFPAGKSIPAKMLAHCIALALTHHLRKRAVDKTRDRHDPSHHHRHRSRPG
jgi:Domain of unknown function (DU1801)